MLELYSLIVIRPQVKVPLERERREHKVEDNHEPLLRLIVQEGEYEDHDYLLNQALHVCLWICFSRGICLSVQVLVEGEGDQETYQYVGNGADYRDWGMQDVDPCPALEILLEDVVQTITFLGSLHTDKHRGEKFYTRI